MDMRAHTINGQDDDGHTHDEPENDTDGLHGDTELKTPDLIKTTYVQFVELGKADDGRLINTFFAL
jgi:hypothetical protein